MKRVNGNIFYYNNVYVYCSNRIYLLYKNKFSTWFTCGIIFSYFKYEVNINLLQIKTVDLLAKIQKCKIYCVLHFSIDCCFLFHIDMEKYKLLVYL